jgi:hypothetical protein
MKLVLFYGPPAVGKLTIANALQKATGFKIIHNHLISDLVLSVFGRGTPEATELNHRIRCLLYEAAAQSAEKGIISTVIYRYDIKEQVHGAITDYLRIMQKHGGEACVVRLSCDPQTLEERVASPSRLGTKKISSVEKLREVLAREDLTRELPQSIAPSLHIDTTHIEPSVAAEHIRSHFNL